jgi:mannitol/fructose-specific phosphotransferase system IIA component (Ntr-type)
VQLSDLLPPAQIRVPLTATTKQAVIDELLGLLPVDDPEVARQVRAAVVTREQELTTGIGRGVAIPHGQSNQVKGHLCAFGVAAEGVDFASIDGAPCRVFFLCVSHPDDVRVHVRVLSQMCRILNNEQARNDLAGASDAAAVRAVFLADEARAAD